jgi:hypothetical protein
MALYNDSSSLCVSVHTVSFMSHETLLEISFLVVRDTCGSTLLLSKVIIWTRSRVNSVPENFFIPSNIMSCLIFCILIRSFSRDFSPKFCMHCFVPCTNTVAPPPLTSLSYLIGAYSGSAGPAVICDCHLNVHHRITQAHHFFI